MKSGEDSQFDLPGLKGPPNGKYFCLISYGVLFVFGLKVLFLMKFIGEK